MLNYYKKRLEESKEKLRLAKIGYQFEVKATAKKLINAYSWDAIDLIFDSVKKSRNAIELIEYEVKYIEERYEEECNKPENKTIQAKKILFGGNK